MLSAVTERILGLHGLAAVIVVFLLPALEASAFVGFLFPGEIAVLLGGVLAAQHKVGLAAVMVAAVAGAIIGDSLGYEIGRKWGRRILEGTVGRVVRRDHLDRAEQYLQRKGGRAVFFGRFTAALRVMVPGLAGMSGLPYGRFLAYNAAGGLIWAVGFVLAGYVAGDSWRKVEHVAGRAGVVLLLLFVLIGGVVMAARWAARHQDRLRAGVAAQLERPAIVRIRARYDRQLRFVARRVSPSGALGLSLTVSLAALVATGWALGILVQDVVVGVGAARFDLPVLRWFARHREPWLTTAMKTVTVLGDSALLIPLVVTVGLALWWRLRRARPLMVLVAGYGGADLLSQAIRALTARTRPPPVYAVGHFAGHSFPSGHATEATAAFGMLAFVIAALTPRWKWRVVAWTAAVLAAGLVGISRMYLGAHWLTDVLAGWALGGAWLFLVVTVDRAVAGLRAAPVASRLQMQAGRNKG